MSDLYSRRPSAPRERRGGLNLILVMVASVVLFFVLFANLVTENLLFQPGPASYGESVPELIRIPAADGTLLAAFWGPVPRARRTILYFHGNAEDIGDAVLLLNNYRLLGCNVLCFDYRGYGLTPGEATEKNALRDAEAVYRYALETLQVPESEIVLHGRSLGAGVAMRLAATQKPGALILESAFLSVYRLYLPLQWIPGDKFDNARQAKRVRAPALVLHGRSDAVVPFSHGETLATALGSERVETVWLEAGHNDLIARQGSLYWAAVKRFLASLD